MAEHILRDISLQEAVQNGVKPAESLLDRPLLKRVNSTNDLDVNRDDELSYKDNLDSASMRNRETETHD